MHHSDLRSTDRPIYFPELLAVTYAKTDLVPIPLDRLSGEPLLDRRTLHGPPEVATIAAWWDVWPDAMWGQPPRHSDSRCWRKGPLVLSSSRDATPESSRRTTWR
jgi:hypothetical protein